MGIKIVSHTDAVRVLGGDPSQFTIKVIADVYANIAGGISREDGLAIIEALNLAEAMQSRGLEQEIISKIEKAEENIRRKIRSF